MNRHSVDHFGIAKRFLPILFIFIVWFIFAKPYFLDGKVPFPSSYQVNHFSPWSAYPQFWGPVKNNAMPDVIDQMYPWRYFSIQTWKRGEIPLWNPYSFSGTPFLANYQSAVLSPFNLLFFLPLQFVDAWTILIVLTPLLAGLFTYMFARSISLSRTASLFSSISFMFSGFITVWMAYGTLSYAILFLPLALYGVEKYLQEKKKAFLLIIFLTLPLSFFSGHFQISIYFLLFLILYTGLRSFSQKNPRPLFIFGAILLGLLASSPQLLPSFEYFSQSARSTFVGKVESIPLSYLPTLIAPDFFGNPVTRNDWFGHYAEWSSYIGVLSIFLALYALLNKKDSRVFILFAIGIFSLILALNTPLSDLLVQLHFPVLSGSAQSRIIILFSFSAALLSGFGFEQIFWDIKNRRYKGFFCWVVASLAIFLALWMIAMFGLGVLAGDQERIAVAKRNLVLPTLLFLLSVGFLFLGTFLRKSKVFQFLPVILVLIISFDMLRFVTKWMPYDPRSLVYTPTPLSHFFSRINSYERVIANFGAETGVYYGLSLVEGYEPLFIRRYAEFVSAVSSGKIRDLSRYVVAFPRDSENTGRIADFLGVKYIIHKISDDHFPWAFPFWKYEDQFRLVFKDSAFEVYENTKAYPRAFFVDKYIVKSKKEDIVSTLFSQDFDLRKVAVLEEEPKTEIASSSSSARILLYSPNKAEIEANTEKASLLLFTDPFYSGWKAYVDGRETKIYRADFAFRAIVVPKGAHKIEFIFNPESFRIGLALGGAGLLGFLALLKLSSKEVIV